MTAAVERCHCIRTIGPDDLWVDMLNEVFASMERSWPGATFRNFSLTVRPIPEETANCVDLLFEAVHP